MAELSERLKLIRGKRTQEEFAAILNLTKQKISNYENNKVKPTTSFYKAMATKLNINLNWLLTGEGEMYSTAGGRESELLKRIRDLEQELAAKEKLIQKTMDSLSLVAERKKSKYKPRKK